MDYDRNTACGGGIIMLEGLIWFVVIIIIIPMLYLVENLVKSMLPGYNKAYFFQPVYRLIKLFGKKDMKSCGSCQWFSVVSCWFALCALYFTVMGENILFIFSCLILMELFTLAGAWNAKEASGAMAAQRGITRLVVCAFTFLICAASMHQVAGTVRLSGIFAYSWMHYMLLQLPLTFTAMVVVLLIKGSLLYFDFRITGKGLKFLDSALYTPYSGWSLALTQITQWVEIGIWIKLISAFLPWMPWVSFTVSAIGYLAFLLLDSFISKSQWKQVARNAWLWGGGMSLMNFIWLYLL